MMHLDDCRVLHRMPVLLEQQPVYVHCKILRRSHVHELRHGSAGFHDSEIAHV